MSNSDLIDRVSKQRGYLGLEKFDSRALEHLRTLDRARFSPPGTPDADIYRDAPLPIGMNQTCSQPSMVAAMATMLELKSGHKVLEVGTGCGYSAALTARMISPGGTLFSIEIIREVAAQARENLSGFEFDAHIELIVGDGSAGLPREAPFDRIYLTAGAGPYFKEEIFIDQLAPDGILVWPESFGNMYVVRKTGSGITRREHGSVGFVQLKGENSGY